MAASRKKLLIVEDDSALRDSVRDRLSLEYEIYEAEDGEQAVSMCLDYRPDVILLDLLLPKLDGIKVLERIRSYPDPEIAKTHVVVLSNLWSQKDILQVEGLKVDQYFVKPHTKLDDVFAKINMICKDLPVEKPAS